MILVLAGTQDGRELADKLVQAGYRVTASVVSAYGRDLIKNSRIAVNAAPMDKEQLTSFIAEQGIAAVVDASHPYATNVSGNAIAACEQAQIPYLRYERPATKLPAYPKLHLAVDYEAAARTAAALGKVIFLTTGSRKLSLFKGAPELAEHRLIARVLPEPGVIRECIESGFTPGDIIAMQGPFSHELNVALFREYKAEAVITKNSGNLGGSDTKLTAAAALDLPVVVIDRPVIHYPAVVHTAAAVLNFLKEDLSNGIYDRSGRH